MDWQELRTHELTIYSTTWCPDCRRLKKHLDKQGLTYTEINIDADPEAAQRLQAATGRTAIPFVQIDSGPMVRGWHDDAPGRWDADVFLAEIETALA
jgi:mycoredoxin